MGKQFVDLGSKLMVIDCYLPILPAMQVFQAADDNIAIKIIFIHNYYKFT